MCARVLLPGLLALLSLVLVASAQVEECSSTNVGADGAVRKGVSLFQARTLQAKAKNKQLPDPDDETPAGMPTAAKPTAVPSVKPAVPVVNPADAETVSPPVVEKAAAEPSFAAPSTIFKKAFAEYVAMTLFVIIGCGSACGIAQVEGAAWILQVALSFGFAITVLAYSIGHYSGGQINCAVTFGLMLVGKESLLQGSCNILAQFLGSVTGALILTMIYPIDKDLTKGLGSNGVGKGWTGTNALVGETMMTFLLMYVVLEVAVNPLSAANRAQACIAIGLAVFLAHSVLIPIDGCSINPTRSFGPALVAKMRYQDSTTFQDMWIFFAGPLLGAGLAAGLYTVMSTA